MRVLRGRITPRRLRRHVPIGRRPGAHWQERRGRRRSEGGIARVPREGDDVADVGDAGRKHDEALEAEAKAAMGDRAVLAEVEVALVRGHVPVFGGAVEDALEEGVVTVLTLAAADELPDAGHEDVHRGDGLAIRVELHVESLDVLWVVEHRHRLLEDNLADVPV